jgi:outer membrane protein
MKKVLLVAAAVLAMAACKNNGGGAAEGSAAGAEGANGAKVETVYDIAYIRMDSLVQGYNRYLDLSSAFEAKATKAQSDLEARGRSLQSEMTSFEDKVNKGLMTTRDAQAEQTRLQNKAAQFDADRQARVGELAEEEQVMTNQIFHAINDYVAKFNADLRYKMILTTSGGSPVIHADPALDITREVLKGLNEEYAA